MHRSTPLLVLAAVFALGCSAKLKHHSVDDFQNPAGVPWVEAREYQVLVYQGTSGGSGKLLYFNRHQLTDRVNGQTIDPARPKYETNYSSGPFATGTLALELHANGALRTARIDTTGGTAAALGAIDQAAGVEGAIEDKELDRLERERDLQKVRDELDELDDE